MDPPILVSLDPDPGYLFLGKYGDFHIINQISQKPFLTFFLGGRHILFFNLVFRQTRLCASSLNCKNSRKNIVVQGSQACFRYRESFSNINVQLMCELLFNVCFITK